MSNKFSTVYTADMVKDLKTRNDDQEFYVPELKQWLVTKMEGVMLYHTNKNIQKTLKEEMYKIVTEKINAKLRLREKLDNMQIGESL